MNANPDLALAIELWNMMENKYLLNAMEISMPSIKVNKKIYIPMTDMVMTRDNLDKLPVFSYGQTQEDTESPHKKQNVLL